MGIHAIGLRTRVPNVINAISDVGVKLTFQLKVCIQSSKAGSREEMTLGVLTL
jgi:hypothetical protein